MKTKLFFVAAAVAMISLSSCKKDWTCECDVESGGSATYEFKDTKKKDAEEACDEWDSTEGLDCTLSQK